MPNHVIPSRFIAALSDLIHELVIGNYEVIERNGYISRLSAQEIQQTIQNYGYHRIDHPEESFTSCILSFLPLQDETAKWAEDIALWTAEEGMSDLTLQVIVEATSVDLLIEIDDLRVM